MPNQGQNGRGTHGTTSDKHAHTMGNLEILADGMNERFREKSENSRKGFFT